MSYKIHNGFKFKTKSMDAVRTLVEHWKPELAKSHRSWLARLQAEMAISLIDEEATSPGKHEGKVPLDEVRKNILDRMAEMDASRCRDPEIDPDFELSVFVHDTGSYGIVHTERSEWLEEWLRQDFVEEFAYWNGTDGRPDGVDREAWDRRHKLWSEMLDSGKPDAFQCTDRELSVTAEEVFAARPDFATRLRKTARRLAELGEFVRRENETRPEGGESDQERFHRLISIAADTQRWMNEEGQPAVADAAATACERLLPDIDEDDLLTVITPPGSTQMPVAAGGAVPGIGSA